MYKRQIVSNFIKLVSDTYDTIEEIDDVTCVNYINDYKSTKFFDIIIEYHEQKLTPMLYVCQKSVINIVPRRQLILEMIKCGADIDICHNGWSTFAYACYFADIDFVTKICEYKYDINQQDNTGRTSLMRSLFFGQYDLAQLLIQKSADIHICDNYNKTALVYACGPPRDVGYIYGPERENTIIMLIKSGAEFIEYIDEHILNRGMKIVDKYIRDIYREKIMESIDDKSTDNIMHKCYGHLDMTYIVKMSGEFII
ncbi:MAG: hypothetical protein Faunusvirus11_5 [Faunusvirus sp.]|uniref:Uncharacterized protein n=1 Tax=Faunusvirus sp. TaxID=2487766 RepID=A0A3G4ZWT5_9VIRU|nr:MAG: hypothetical protein Faunusvirus11_5 [Faunusvirus sp.]